LQSTLSPQSSPAIVPVLDDINILLWNVEGFSGLLKVMPDKDSFFKKFDVIVLTETFVTSTLDLPGFYSVNQPAKQGMRGRPYGGIGCYVSPKMGPILGHSYDRDDYLIVKLKNFNVLCFYLGYLYKDVQVLSSLLSAFDVIKNDNKPCIALGDFNCNLVKRLNKTATLIDTMSQNNLKLYNHQHINTYFGPNGASTIDLLFADPIAFSNITYGTVCDYSPSVALRKHVPIQFKLNVSIPNVVNYKTVVKSNLSNRINNDNLISTFSVQSDKLQSLFISKNTNQIYLTIKDIIYQTAEPKNTKIRISKPWFDRECYLARKQVLILRHNNNMLSKYSEIRSSYRDLLIVKRDKYNVKQEGLLIQMAEETPYTYLNKDKISVVQCPIPIYDWEPYFSSLLNEKSLSASESLNLSALVELYESEIQFSPISTYEVAKYASQLKNNKATGPDNVTNEHMKAVSLPLLQFFADFFNLCVDTATVPDDWKHSYIKVLFKGKGDLLSLVNYRGLALGCIPYKLFDAIMNGRLFSLTNHLIPDTQFGFMPGRCTLQAISLLQGKIVNALNVPNGCLYVVFLDFLKAFDTVDREILMQKLIDTKLLSKKHLMLLARLLDVNYISVHDGLLLSEKIIQSNGVLQGAVSSPLLFNLLTCDLKQDLFGPCGPIDDDEIDIYADDTALICKNRFRLQWLLNLLVGLINELGLKINTSKTKVMKFRKAGNLCKADIILCNNVPLEFVSNFKYLGVVFQQSGTTFTLHVNERHKAAIAASFTISKLNLISLPTVIKLFNIKIAPIATYGIEIIWPFLKKSDFNILETVKSSYLKRALSLSKYTHNRLVYKLADTDFFVSELQIKFNLIQTDSFKEFISECKAKALDIHPLFYSTPAFTNQRWKGASCINRHLYTRFAVHGFHHTLCLNSKFHDCDPNKCICKLCNEKFNDLYHFQVCIANPKIADYANLA
jgi:Reverse transcriptase (RNA-dependent DNA polymerase)